MFEAHHLINSPLLFMESYTAEFDLFGVQQLAGSVFTLGMLVSRRLHHMRVALDSSGAADSIDTDGDVTASTPTLTPKPSRASV